MQFTYSRSFESGAQVEITVSAATLRAGLSALEVAARLSGSDMDELSDAARKIVSGEYRYLEVADGVLTIN